MKDMIRRSGENIAAAEVEEALMRHPGVRRAAVLAVEGDLRGEEVMAYVVPGDGVSREEVSPSVLSAFCAKCLARFKVPRYWKYRDDLPRTPSGTHPQGGVAERARRPCGGGLGASGGAMALTAFKPSSTQIARLFLFFNAVVISPYVM